MAGSLKEAVALSLNGCKIEYLKNKFSESTASLLVVDFHEVQG